MKHGFADIKKVLIPKKCTLTTQEHLARVGRDGNEGFVLWVGEPRDDVFHVTEVIVPAQQGRFVGGGVCVTVHGDELHRINMDLYHRKLRLIAQVHSHPTDAYHSDTDDAFPIATTVGCLSLVVPDFAVRPFNLEECAVYRLTEHATWRELTSRELSDLIVITEA